MNAIILAFIGGVIIGLCATLMLLFEGNILGISGFLRKTLKFESLPAFFILGLLVAGYLASVFYPESLVNTEIRSTPILLLAGFLVGFGTSLGNGCTSGHGVCGLSRFSYRSLIATLCFMGSGVLSTTLFRILGAE